MIGATRTAARVLAGVGIAAFLSGLLLSLDSSASLARFELPLGRTEGITLDRDGRIYVGSPGYRRVARYAPDGSFDRAWHAPVGRGAWRLATSADGTLHLDVAGRTHALVADAELRDVGESSAFAHLAWSGREVVGSDGAVYELRRVPARVVRRPPGSAETTLVRQPWLAIALGSPLPAWPLAAAGFLVLWLTDGAARRAAAA